MDKLDKVNEKLNCVEQKFEENTLALEMLKELKISAQHKFIIIIILIIALVGTNLAWLIREYNFETVMETEETTQTIDDIQNPTNTTFTQTIN